MRDEELGSKRQFRIGHKQKVTQTHDISASFIHAFVKSKQENALKTNQGTIVYTFKAITIQ